MAVSNQSPPFRNSIYYNIFNLKFRIADIFMKYARENPRFQSWEQSVLCSALYDSNGGKGVKRDTFTVVRVGDASGYVPEDLSSHRFNMAFGGACSLIYSDNPLAHIAANRVLTS